MNELLWTAGFLAIFCILLYFGNRWKMKYDTEGTVNQDPTTSESKGLIPPNALTGEVAFQPIDHSKTREWKGRIDYKQPEDKDFTGSPDLKAVLDETDPMQLSGLDVNIDWKNPKPSHTDRNSDKLLMLIEDEASHFDRSIVTGFSFHNWTEFKERNPELFKVTLTGSVLNGILFHKENDAVIHYTLEGDIPPNGDYIINGILNGKVLNVTGFKAVDII